MNKRMDVAYIAVGNNSADNYIKWTGSVQSHAYIVVHSVPSLCLH